MSLSGEKKKCAVHLYKSIQSEVTPCTQHGRAIDILKIVLTLETLGTRLFPHFSKRINRFFKPFNILPLFSLLSIYYLITSIFGN